MRYIFHLILILRIIYKLIQHRNCFLPKQQKVIIIFLTLSTGKLLLEHRKNSGLPIRGKLLNYYPHCSLLMLNCVYMVVQVLAQVKKNFWLRPSSLLNISSWITRQLTCLIMLVDLHLVLYFFFFFFMYLGNKKFLALHYFQEFT